MSETMTNTESDTSFDIFEDEDFQTENGQEQGNEEPNQTPSEQKEEEPQAEETTLPVKFLGKEYPIPQSEIKSLAERLNINEDEVIATIQKGLNYDHAVANTPLHKRIARLAELNGKTPEEYSDFLDNAANEIGLRHEIENVRKQYPELSDEAVEIIAQKNVENGKLSEYKRAKETEEKQEKDRENELAPYRAFCAKYPDVKEFPQEVAAMINAGTDPTFAYELYTKNQEQIKNLTNENTELKQKQTNYYSSMGSSKASAAGEDYDDFLSGFFGE
nr:MAG TPA_asm: hypothetical protein [Caudoviricetes sp.]